MDPIWSHKSSVTRDFALLSAVIVFIALLTSVWVSYETYTDQSRKVSAEMEQEALRIERGFHSELNRASYLLEAIGRQMLQRGNADLTQTAQTLRAFDTNNDYYSVFLWVDERLQAVTSSRQGVLETPIDLSDREYITRSRTEPFKIQVGKPVEGRISRTLVIPMAMGLTDYTGRYIGSVTLSLDLKAMTHVVQEYVRNQEVGFAVLDENLNLLTQDARAQKALADGHVLEQLAAMQLRQGGEGVVTQPSLVSSNREFSYYRQPAGQSYVILTAYVSEWSALNRLILPRLMQLLLVAAFLVSLLWLVRFRVIYPVQTLSEASADIARGNTTIEVPRGGPLEITHLSRQLQNIVDYISERKRIEEELIAKVLALKTAKDIAEVGDQAKMEILRSLRQEIYPAMELVLGAASILQDQPYGPIKGKQYAESIGQLDSGSTHLAEVIHEVFEFPRLMQAEPLLIRKPVDVGGILHKCVTLLAATLRQEEVSVTIRVQNDLPRLSMNELHLIHVIMHLLVASVRSIPAGGDLTIEATLEGNEAAPEFAILFKDNGTGLDTQHIARLWRANEPVLRGSKPVHADDDRISTISAITLTKKIITLHNGRMTMQNPPGKEAIIGVYFQL